MKRKLTMFLALFFIWIGIVTAQTQVRGTVVDESGIYRFTDEFRMMRGYNISALLS